MSDADAITPLPWPVVGLLGPPTSTMDPIVVLAIGCSLEKFVEDTAAPV